ncbi:hypothetical protein MAR_006734 [Mya arenaria]|uniref:Uncharacterized protein n=1 Tax=Mya arenaria TaxID=6604 RepID=A0ABY7DAG8_MYAAR|nr:hypothetical protein MAR_006734 [Mya arenaria]
MPSEYRKDFSTSLISIDGTEINTQSPYALGLQSQIWRRLIADKGFTIHREISDLGLKLNSPPVAITNSQMPALDTL